MRRFSTALVFMFLLPSWLPAQGITGSVVGTITDPTGAGVPGAKVSVFNLRQSREEQTITTDSSGNYTAVHLSVGAYRITIEAAGFKRVVRDNVIVNVNDNLTVSAKVEVGDLAQTVTVEEAPVQVELQNATQATTITGTQIREQALVTRNYAQLLQSVPGVTSASVDQLYVGVTVPSGSSAQIPFSINGARNSANAWLVDGADNVDRGSNLTLLNTPSIDAIEEFKVLRSNYSAEFGRAAGGQISVITKSGTSQFHGDVYEFVRNNAFAANNFINNANSLNLGSDGKARVPGLHYNNFGYTVGGPVYIPGHYNKDKNKTFFFFSEEFRRVITYTTGTAILPSAAEIGGTFPTPVCVSYTGSTCNQTATQINNFDPVAKAYIADIYSKLPLGTVNSANNLVSLFRNVYNFRQELIKVDHIFSPKLHLSARYLRDDIPTVEPQGLFTGVAVPGVANTSTNAPGHNFTARAESVFSPTWLNEFGYSYSYGAIVSNPSGTINSSLSPDIKPALPFASTLGRVPGLAFASGTSITSFGPYRDFNRNNNFFDNMSKIFGDHTLRMGATYNHYQKTENNGGANAGSFSFTPASVPTGTTQFQQSFANFLLGNASSFSQASEDVTPDIRANQFELYLQDDWRVAQHFTLNFGLRYSKYFQPTDANKQLTSFAPEAYKSANAAVLTAGGLLAAPVPIPYLNGIVVANSNSPFGSSIGSSDSLNFAPRFGFAWDPFGTGKTAIRGGYGIFFDSTSYGIFENNIFANPPYVNSATITNTSLSNPAGGTATVSNSPKNPRGTAYVNHTPYSQQWNLEIQRQITRTSQINVAYVRTKGTHLIGQVDINEVPPGLAYSSGLIAPNTPITSANTPLLNVLRPYQGYGAIGVIEPWFNSNYNGLQIYGKKEFASDALVTFNYTWSKGLTNAQTDTVTAQNTYNLTRGEYGPTLLDRTHVFNLNLVYPLPFFKAQHGLVGKALGGWEIAANANYYSGLPYTATTSGTDPGGLGIIGASSAGLRPNLICDPTVGALHTRQQYFNTACFAAPPVSAHVPGNSGRGIIRGPGYEGWNLAASKNLLFKERFRFQLRGEASNAFNHSNPNTFGSLSIVSAAFGTVTTYRDPRIIQLAGKFYF